MPIVLSLLIAVIVALGLVLGSRYWFGRVQKRRHAETIGIEAISARHWRDALTLLVSALEDRGLTPGAELSGPQGAPLGERILRRGSATVLLIYKHGTAYRIGAPALRDAEKRRQEAGIDEVLIATLGEIDPEARAQATRMHVECLDGSALWALMGGRLDPSIREAIDTEAEQRIHGPRRMSTLGAAVLGLAIVYWGGGVQELIQGGNSQSERVTVAPAPQANLPAVGTANPSPPAASAAASALAAATATASETTAAPSASEALDAERTTIAKALSALPAIERASWSSGSTVILTVSRRSTLDTAFTEACSLVSQFPALAELRLQLEASDGSDVRWRRCA